jgi:hypothetical protein
MMQSSSQAAPSSTKLFNSAFHQLPAERRAELERHLAEGQLTMRSAVTQGYANVDSIEEWVDFWHQSPAAGNLQSFLGLDNTEYSRWLRDAAALPAIFGV